MVVANQLVPEHPAFSTSQVILWWELRRLPYNGLLLIIGVLSIIGMERIISPVLPLGVDAVEPMLLVPGIALYGFMANLCYTMGWVLELWNRKRDSFAARERGLRMFRTGMFFSCVLTTLPFWFACAWRLSRLIVSHIN